MDIVTYNKKEYAKSHSLKGSEDKALVQYKNDFNRFSIFSKINAFEMDIITYIIKELRFKLEEDNIGNCEFVIPADDFFQMFRKYHHFSSEEKLQYIRSAVTAIQSIKLESAEITQNQKVNYASLLYFPSLLINEEANTITVKINNEIMPYFMNFTKNYMSFRWDVFCAITSEYSKNLYRLICERKQKTPSFYCSIEDLDKYLNIDGNMAVRCKNQAVKRAFMQLNKCLQKKYSKLQGQGNPEASFYNHYYDYCLDRTVEDYTIVRDEITGRKKRVGGKKTGKAKYIIIDVCELFRYNDKFTLDQYIEVINEIKQRAKESKVSFETLFYQQINEWESNRLREKANQKLLRELANQKKESDPVKVTQLQRENAQLMAQIGKERSENNRIMDRREAFIVKLQRELANVRDERRELLEKVAELKGTGGDYFNFFE